MPKSLLFFFSIFLFLIEGFVSIPISFAGGMAQPGPETKSTRDLKQYMYKFGTLVSGIEMIRIKEKTPDWQAIQLALDDMTQTVQSMQQTDTTNAYRTFTDELAKQLEELQKMNRAKNQKIYDQVEKLTETCFQCHAVHRPSDFLKPKKTQNLGMKK